MTGRVGRSLVLLSWVLWGTIWGEDAVTPVWRDLADFPTEAACTAALAQERQAHPDLRTTLESPDGRVTQPPAIPRRFRCVRVGGRP